MKRSSAAGWAALVMVAVGPFVLAQAPKPKEWHDYAGSPEGTRYVPLNQITKANLDKLDVAWSYPYAETGVNPIVAHGVIYTRARNKSMVAIDAATGKEIWIHDGLQGMTERGINYWESADGTDRRLIFSAADYLQELDAKTGKSIRNFGRDGTVDLRDELGRNPNAIRVQSGTPGKIFENLVILGSAVGEGYFSAPGDLRAYNVITGKLAWQFHTVPHPGEYGYDTWPKEAWRYIGGVNTWGEISVDSARGIAYFPTGSPTFDYYGADRVGNGLFGNCLIAIDVHTGKRLWHFQNVHHDMWDFDNVAAPMLITITHNGKKVDAVAMAGKTGYLYVFDRVTGEPIWPIVEKKAPTKTDVPGEVLSPTQPIPTAPPPFGRQSYTVDDVNPYILTDEQRAKVRARVAKARNDGQFTPIGFSEVIHMPGNHGGANWGGTSANPENGSVYVIAYNAPAFMRLMTAEEQEARGARGGAFGGPGQGIYAQNCQGCHGATLAGGPTVPSLVGVSTRLGAAELRKTIHEGKGEMPGFQQLSSDQVDALVAFLAGGGRGGGRGGRGVGPTSFPPGPIVETGTLKTRPDNGGGRGGSMPNYPEGAEGPSNRFTMDGYGLDFTAISPPWTTLTAYDLNKGVIKWQIGLGDDYRAAVKGVKGTGAAEFLKSSVIVTSTGLLFVTAADRKLHIYDSETGKQLREIAMGANTSGSPSMYEFDGRQYLLLTASAVGTRIGGEGHAADPAQTGPTGLVAFALKK
ncbi:MAG TPA: PQQ-binding-like beta-propeller repeat protein [Bryobacteraceae bacterium]